MTTGYNYIRNGRVFPSVFMCDIQGNPISYLGHTLAWEKGRQLKSYDNFTYTYNANGIRTSKTVNGEVHKYDLEGTKILRESWKDVNNVIHTIVPLYDNEGNVCGITYNNTTYFFVKNLQGDIISLLDTNGKTVVRYRYDAWGNLDSVRDENNLSISPNVAHIANINPFRYRGYYYDNEIGLYYLQSRYYDPKVGRFVNSDAPEMTKLQIEGHFIIPNQFHYCYSDPVNDADKTGYGGADSLLNAIITAFNVIVGINDIAATTNYTANDIKKIRKSTKKSKRQIQQEIINAKRKSNNLSKRFNTIGVLLTIMSVILLVYACASNASSIYRMITDSVVEMFVFILIKIVSKISEKLLKLVPIPGISFVLGFAAGYAIEGIFSAWFTSKKKKRIKNSFYTSARPLLQHKSTNFLKYINYFIKSLKA